MKDGRVEPHGEHHFYGQPYGLVWTSAATAEGWSRVLSHEVVEMLEDATLDVRYLRDGSSWQREIAAPVDSLGYRLRGVYVSDFRDARLVRGREHRRRRQLPGRELRRRQLADRAGRQRGAVGSNATVSAPWATVGPELG